MSRVRALMAACMVATLVPSLISAPHAAHAGGGIGIAATDFAQVTPDTAIVYAAIQSTSADQPINLKRLGDDFAAQPGFQKLFKDSGGTTSSSTDAATAVASQLQKGLRSIFNGEFGMALLPITLSPGTKGTPTARLHVLLDAGLQPSVTASQLWNTLALLGLLSSASTRYRNLPVVSVDISAALALLNSGSNSKMTLTPDSPISGTFYGAVAGNDAVLASDLPSLKRAIDTWFGARPAISATPGFQNTLSTLPAARLLTLYGQLNINSTIQILQRLSANAPVANLPKNAGSVSQAFSVTAEPDGMLFSTSSSYRTGAAAAVSAQLSPLPNGAANLLPSNTLIYAAINDPATLIRAALKEAGRTSTILNLSARKGGRGMNTIPIPADPIKAINAATGLNLDQDVFSWLHGDASLALLPVDTEAVSGSGAATRISLVGTAQVPDPVMVQAKLVKIDNALKKLAGPKSADQLTLVDVPGPSGMPLHLLAGTPGGLGYTFYNGYLVAATTLPADIAELQRGSAGDNLSGNPHYRAGLRYATAGQTGALLYLDITRLRQLFERIGAASGTDMRDYNSSGRPLLTAFKSLTDVSYAGPNGGNSLFIGIGR